MVYIKKTYIIAVGNYTKPVPEQCGHRVRTFVGLKVCLFAYTFSSARSSFTATHESAAADSNRFCTYFLN